MIVGFEVDGFHIIDELFWKRQARRAIGRWTRVLPIVRTDSVPGSRVVQTMYAWLVRDQLANHGWLRSLLNLITA